MSDCPLCEGKKEKGFTTYTVEFEGSILIVKKVPVNICSQCGEEWVPSEVAKKLEKITSDVRKKKPELEILSFDEAA